MRSSLRRHLCPNVCILRSVSAYCVKVSQPESRMETTRDLVGKLMELLIHNLLILAIAAVAMAILIPTSVVLVPSFDKVTP
ncbi:hypothetical protein DPMN_140986 [Dreissena polymorpha]|uniref:Uncharacterized protein n=1 Tax=Dreissena polymorpha TaxID=45954 RepID=A0A9D4G8K2_DREPO|nr:hypothetical protein DPMN_140986 [Dreissena polymorpha]